MLNSLVFSSFCRLFLAGGEFGHGGAADGEGGAGVFELEVAVAAEVAFDAVDGGDADDDGAVDAQELRGVELGFEVKKAGA